ncbi:hypothetical protein PHYPO_G00091090 [Pangasianodon hypophthalmus]|uniref:Uncharacterized protein n=1 Tax=Pangasianodon hypophthalmus TaxID=310915 RepID=A0A5N5LA95_PANHP|nr:hypothetical protein PHYPO_G00091090 [Pangasianodon hypophthalmus]
MSSRCAVLLPIPPKFKKKNKKKTAKPLCQARKLQDVKALMRFQNRRPAFTVGSVGPYNIQVQSLNTLMEDSKVSDKVMDSICNVLSKNRPGVVHINCRGLTKILDGSKRAKSHYFLKNNILEGATEVFGTYLEGGNHWSFFGVVDLPLEDCTPLTVESPLRVKMLVQVNYGEQQKYVKLDRIEELFDFHQFHLKVIERFCLPPDATVMYKDASGTEVDEEIFSDLIGQDSFSSEMSDSSSSSSASTVILNEVPNKRQRTEEAASASAKQLIEDVLKSKSGGEAVIQEYQATETLTDATRRQMINILVAHLIETHGQLPTKAIREQYALGIVMLFPSLRDPYSKKGYEHFYDPASNTGYIAWRMKTVPRKIR